LQHRIAIAEQIVSIFQGYLGVGLVVAVLFSLLALPRLDAGARFDRAAPAGSVLFRVMVIPAATLLWPVVLVRALVLLRAARAPGGAA
jgi:hypothetical protein